jgi:hypothetical protein
MKTFSASPHHTMRHLLAGLTLAAGLFFGGVASAQSVQFVDKAPLHSQTRDAFKVAVFPVANSLLMKVVLENPNKERVTVLIRNSKNEVVYRKVVGRSPIFHGKFDVSKIEDGTYTMVIQSARQSYANPFSVATFQERIARAL